MDRRSFILTLFGGLATASLGGVARAEAAKPVPAPEPVAGEDLAPETAEALDGADAGFSQYRRRRYYRRRYYRPYRRYYRRPRYYYRPRRRYYRRYR